MERNFGHKGVLFRSGILTRSYRVLDDQIQGNPFVNHAYEWYLTHLNDYEYDLHVIVGWLASKQP